MLTKTEITDFLTRTMNDRTLRINKVMLHEICEMAMNGIDLRINMVPNNGRTALRQAYYANLEEAIAAFEEETGYQLPRVLPREMQQNLKDPEKLKTAFDNLIAAGQVDDADLGEAANNDREMSLEEMLDSPLTDVPANGTVMAGGNPPCDIKTPKSTPPSLPKAKTTHR
jgi:hypothetical protein